MARQKYGECPTISRSHLKLCLAVLINLPNLGSSRFDFTITLHGHDNDQHALDLEWDIDESSVTTDF